jgi:hypothetical protein
MTTLLVFITVYRSCTEHQRSFLLVFIPTLSRLDGLQLLPGASNLSLRRVFQAGSLPLAMGVHATWSPKRASTKHSRGLGVPLAAHIAAGMYRYMYVCMYVCMYVYVCMYMYVCIYIYHKEYTNLPGTLPRYLISRYPKT